MPAQADPDYVMGLFDDYAERFDAHLVGSLGYRGPAVLMAALDSVAGAQAQFARVLDLGCGTGLMGGAIRARAGDLRGVDLSPRMLAKAQERGLYDGVARADVTDALRETPPASLDLVLAADVLVYLGDLAPVFAAARDALVHCGLFAFTLQATDGSAYDIGADRRYAHSAAYVARIASECELSVAYQAAASTRHDAGKAIAGLVFVLRAG